jgi:flavin-dependent dehydrogenase
MMEDGSKVAIIGGGPSGSFFGYFLLEMAERVGLDVEVDTYEPRDYSVPGPAACNMCGGIISESLVQNLAAEGIRLPSTVVQRGIDSYAMHTDLGSVKLQTPIQEKRIAAIHRGAGPRGMKEMKWGSFDGYLQSLAVERGVNVVKGRVDEVARAGDSKYRVKAKGGEPKEYDLVAVTAGVNTGILKLFEGMDIGYRAPKTTQTAIREYLLGEETIAKYLGSSMHVFMMDIPRMEFAAIIPKGDYVTVAVLGDEIDAKLLESFLTTPQVKACFPPDWAWDQAACNCGPRINVGGSPQPYADGILFIGDAGVSRLYKDGIGAAYKAAKAAAGAVVFHGTSAEALRKHYGKACDKMETDNRIGKFIFAITGLLQRRRFARKAILRMTAWEQKREGQRIMSTVLWDMFTGSAPYKEVLVRTFHPLFWGRLLYDLGASLLPGGTKPKEEEQWRIAH